MVSKYHYLRFHPFTNPDVANKVQFKSLTSMRRFRRTISPNNRCSFFFRHRSGMRAERSFPMILMTDACILLKQILQVFAAKKQLTERHFFYLAPPIFPLLFAKNGRFFALHIFKTNKTPYELVLLNGFIDFNDLN